MPRQPVVVIVEDEAALGPVLAELFKAEGYEAFVVTDCEAARDVAADREVDLVIVDAAPDADPEGFHDCAVIAVRDPRDVGIPFFGAWRVDGRTATLSRPYRLDDLMAAAREVVTVGPS